MDEDKIHDKAVKMRKMTDEQLVHYVEDRVAKARSEGFGEGKLLARAEIMSKRLPIDEILNEINDIKGIGCVKLEKIRRILLKDRSADR